MNSYEYFSGDWEFDNKVMEGYLDKMVIVSGTARNQLCKMKPSEGGSALFGHTWRGYLSPTRNRTRSYLFKTLYQTKLMDEHPEMIDVFKEFAHIYFPDFVYTQITINKNYPVGPHKDSSNTGESYLCCFGDYEGGETGVNFGVDNKYAPVKLNPRLKPVVFNGSKFTHWVEPFKGKRYSLVFYNNIKNWKDKVRDEVKESNN